MWSSGFARGKCCLRPPEARAKPAQKPLFPAWPSPPPRQWRLGIPAIDTETLYVDERPLLVAGTPEVREYRLRFWDKGTPNGDWTPVDKTTVAL